MNNVNIVFNVIIVFRFIIVSNYGSNKKAIYKFNISVRNRFIFEYSINEIENFYKLYKGI